MKKIFFALAALVLAFTGCSQEEDAIQVSEKKAVKVVVNMDKPGFGEDTRAPRTKWEEGDEVVVTLAGQLTAYVKLTYQDETWENQIFVWQEPDGEEGSYVELTEVQSASFIEAIESSASTGSVMAVYFSSGVYQVTYNEAYVNIITKALTQDMGECIMTCDEGDNGTYSVSEGVLTLDIIMKPRVAQYTIRDLNVEDNWNISIEGPVKGYAGGKITTDGVELTLIGEYALDCYPHQNGDDISIFAAPWQSNEDIPDFISFPPGYEITYKMLYYFTVEDGGANSFERGFEFSQVAIGGAVIFDGPYNDGAEDKWYEPV